MARVLTGIQSTGTPHLGNILGAIKPAIELANEGANDSFLFIADLHSLTQIKDGATLRENTYAVAATWMAFGLDTERTVFYRQSDVPECAELAWYLQCFFPYSRMTLAHSFKDKQDRLGDVNAGLFAYPMLMAADILLYDADLVPVGKDQMQHLEMTRDVASRFNHAMGDTFVLPEAMTQEATMYVPGLDGGKMSKSRDNTLNIFDDPKALKKRINKEIVTDATPLEDPKDPSQRDPTACTAWWPAKPKPTRWRASCKPAATDGATPRRRCSRPWWTGSPRSARVSTSSWPTKPKSTRPSPKAPRKHGPSPATSCPAFGLGQGTEPRLEQNQFLGAGASSTSAPYFVWNFR